ncbi:MAG: M20/M25/M40 family metallo-hydrolase, partial [Bacillota bacterium]|nr:M20/M25/M40 family metallo-hydrolase [Bacillota bacterium]
MKSYLQDEAFKDKLVRIRNDFHANPELSHEEFETTEKIRRYVTDLGYEVLDIGLKTGLVARLRTKEEAPSVLLRADIDALPIHEASDKPYASKVDGKMHACGHDVHATVLIGAAEILAAQ